MYKVLFKNIIIDIIKKPLYCIYFPDTGSKLRTDPTSANCIISSNGEETYHLLGKSPFMPNYKSVELVPIEQEEYDYLNSLIVKGEEFNVDIAKLKEDVIAEMSDMSERIIHAGTDITLSDGNTYHFSFSDQDQYQIGFLATSAKTAQMLEAMGLPTNETGKDYPWHSDGGDCIFYSRQDMITIGTTMQNYITYHNSYFHALRNYIQSLNSPLVIANLHYGVDVPKIHCGEVYEYANS